MRVLLAAAVLSLALAPGARAQTADPSTPPEPLVLTQTGIINPNPTATIGLSMSLAADLPPVIVEVRPGSPAEKAGLAVGDTIVAIDGRAPDEQGFGFKGATPGQRFAVRVRRGAEPLERTLVAGPPPARPANR